MKTSIVNDDPTAEMDATQLAVAARKAHEQKRIKECLSLINQLLLCDPGNIEAQTLRESVFSDVARDLSDARVLLADSQSRADGHKYRKAAEIILLKILYLDPTHAEAKALLAKAKASAEPSQPAPAAVAVEATKPKPAVFKEAKPAALEELAFTAQPTPIKKQPETKNSGITKKLPILLVGLAVLAGGGFFLYKPHAAMSAPTSAAAVATPAPVVPESTPITADAKAVTDSSQIAPAPANPQAVLAAAGPMVVPAPAAAGPGILSVNSAISTEIYVGGKHVGDTPATLQLPAGTNTVEYRHGDLRTLMTHDIKSKETTNAVVSFEVTVQINARPWAQVFVDGTARKPLGQTPLSSVKVPVGTVLAFENPNFPSKSYRVTENDSSIQVAFP